MNFDDKNIITKSNKAIVTNQLSERNNNLAVTSLVLGIISFLFCWTIIVPIIIGIIGTIIGFISLGKKRDGTKIAIAGTVLSIIGLLASTIFLALYIIASFID